MAEKIVNFLKTNERWDYSIPGFDDGYETYTYNANTADSVFDGALTGMRMVNGGTISYTYDHLQRLANRAIGGSLREQYTYAEGKTANADTTRISGKTNWLNGAADQDFRYTYDGNGNILTVTDAVSGETTVYAYDCQNQLLSAITTNGDEILLEEHYTYDGAGNILTSSGGYGSHTYTYGDESWRDLLTAVDGHPIIYDGAGNPTGYYNGYEYEMTWTEGRRLESLTWYGETYSYEYDADGVRTKKNNPDGSSVVYEIVDGRAVGESYIDADGHPFRQLRYIFDETGTAIGFSFRRTERGSWVDYYLVKNLQGDVLKVCRADTGAVEAAYTYDAWGNVLTMSGPMSYINPFLYRSYYFDCETWFYYVSSRYYDPQIGRWINADSQLNTSLGILGLNQFSYCLNNPVNMVDYSGNKPGDLFDTMDEAARDAAEYLGALTWENTWEYSTAIYSVETTVKTYKTVTKRYSFLWWSWTWTSKKTIKTKKTQYTYKAVKTDKKNNSVGVPYAPLFKKRVAAFHTHPMGSWVGITRFSDADKKWADYYKIPIYVHGPNGELRKYDPATGEDVLIFSDLPISPKTPWLD